MSLNRESELEGCGIRCLQAARLRHKMTRSQSPGQRFPGKLGWEATSGIDVINKNPEFKSGLLTKEKHCVSVNSLLGAAKKVIELDREWNKIKKRELFSPICISSSKRAHSVQSTYLHKFGVGYYEGSECTESGTSEDSRVDSASGGRTLRITSLPDNNATKWARYEIPSGGNTSSTPPYTPFKPTIHTRASLSPKCGRGSNFFSQDVSSNISSREREKLLGKALAMNTALKNYEVQKSNRIEECKQEMECSPSRVGTPKLNKSFSREQGKGKGKGKQQKAGGLLSARDSINRVGSIGGGDPLSNTYKHLYQTIEGIKEAQVKEQAKYLHIKTLQLNTMKNKYDRGVIESPKQQSRTAHGYRAKYLKRKREGTNISSGEEREGRRKDSGMRVEETSKRYKKQQYKGEDTNSNSGVSSTLKLVKLKLSNQRDSIQGERGSDRGNERCNERCNERGNDRITDKQHITILSDKQHITILPDSQKEQAPQPKRKGRKEGEFKNYLEMTLTMLKVEAQMEENIPIPSPSIPHPLRPPHKLNKFISKHRPRNHK